MRPARSSPLSFLQLISRSAKSAGRPPPPCPRERAPPRCTVHHPLPARLLYRPAPIITKKFWQCGAISLSAIDEARGQRCGAGAAVAKA